MPLCLTDLSLPFPGEHQNQLNGSLNMQLKNHFDDSVEEKLYPDLRLEC